MFTKLYNKCLELAAHKSSNYFLAIISFLESSFFPIPPDVMIAPMVIAKKNKFIKIFLIATIFSVLGGMIGYILGAYFFDLSMSIVEFYGYEKKVSNLKKALITLMQDINDDISKKKTILFSPSAASFDNFNNFEDRGKYFILLIKKYKSDK